MAMWQQQQFNQRLPPGWEAKYDPTKGRYYFINHATLQTTWVDPRTQVPQHSQPARIVEIPLQNLSPPSQSSHSSRSQAQETTFGVTTNASDAEDEVWKKMLLETAMASLQDKGKAAKDKLKREFKGLDASDVESAVELCNYDEEKARKILQGQKDAMKRRKARREEEERKEKEEMEKRKAEQKKRDAERKQRERLEQLEEERRSAAVKHQPTSEASTTRSIPTITSMISNRGKMPTTKVAAKPAVAKTPQKNTPNTGRKEVYVSKNGVTPTGPQASLRKGPNPKHLLSQWVKVAGPNKTLVSGPQKGNRKGVRATESRVSLSQGPQPSLHKGPRHNSLVKASMPVFAV